MERLNLLAFGGLAGAGRRSWARTSLAHGTGRRRLDGFLRADALSALVVGLTAFVALVCGIYAVGYLRQRSAAGRITARTCCAGIMCSRRCSSPSMLLVPLAEQSRHHVGGHREPPRWPPCCSSRFYNQKTSFEAGWKYIIIGSVGISLALFGTVLTYYSAVRRARREHAANGMNWSVLVGVADNFDPTAMRLAFVMVLLGYGTKAGLAPMHTWKPDAYARGARAHRRVAGRRLHQLRHLRHRAVSTCWRKNAWGTEFPGRLLAGFRRRLHSRRRAVRACAAQFPPPAGVFQH